MFHIALEDNVILKGATKATTSPTEKAVNRCEKVCWLLFKSDYITGELNWESVEPKVRKELLDGLVEYVLYNRDNRPLISYSTIAIVKRLRLMA